MLQHWQCLCSSYLMNCPKRIRMNWIVSLYIFAQVSLQTMLVCSLVASSSWILTFVLLATCCLYICPFCGKILQGWLTTLELDLYVIVWFFVMKKKMLCFSVCTMYVSYNQIKGLVNNVRFLLKIFFFE